MHKKSLNNIICHLLWLKILSPAHTHPLKTSHGIFETLWVIIFWVRVTHKMLNVNWEKIHSIILSVTCHGLRNFPLLIHIPSKPSHEFLKPYELLFSELVTRKMQPQNKGPGMLWGQSYVLPMTWGVEALGPPFGRHAALWLFHFICWITIHFQEFSKVRWLEKKIEYPSKMSHIFVCLS